MKWKVWKDLSKCINQCQTYKEKGKFHWNLVFDSILMFFNFVGLNRALWSIWGHQIRQPPYHWKIYSDFTSVPVWPVLENYAFASPKISLWQYKVKCPILAWNWSQSRLMSSKRPRFMGDISTGDLSDTFLFHHHCHHHHLHHRHHHQFSFWWQPRLLQTDKWLHPWEGKGPTLTR